jgi:hypothetical protein
VPFQITITKTYNVTNLFEDIKALYKIAGFKGQPVCFIFTDAEVRLRLPPAPWCLPRLQGSSLGGAARLLGLFSLLAGLLL